MARVRLVDVDVTVHHETQAGSSDGGAYLVSTDGVRKNAVWVPKTLCELSEDANTLTLSEDIAIEKGLV